MRGHTNLSIEEKLKRDFQALYRGSLSRFLEEMMAEYVEKRRFQWWLICPGCKQKVHINAVLNRGGICPKDGCGAVVAEEIDDKKPSAVQKVSPMSITAEKTENKAEVAPKVLEI